MGALAGTLGLAGGAGGTGFAKPQGANIQAPVYSGQVDQSFLQNQEALGSQQALLRALQGQNGLNNQSQVYNQFQQVASGQGPNPAQAMLDQATGANVANQAALMAGQRGAGANVGLLARQAAMQGANLQQQAVGQGATMQANQALNAIGQAGQLASTQAGQQIGGTQAVTQAAQQEQQNLLNAMAAQNNANVASQGNMNTINAGLAGNLMGGTQKGIGGLFNSAGGISGMLGGGAGGAGSALPAGAGDLIGAAALAANGGDVATLPTKSNGPRSALARALMPAPMASGGAVPALLSPGEIYLKPAAVMAVRQGADPMKVGEKIPGKPAVGGAKNSYSNDTVPKTLQEGGVVIPRSETQSKDPSEAGKRFVAAVAAKKGKK